MGDPWEDDLRAALDKQTKPRFERAVRKTVARVQNDPRSPKDTGALREGIVWDGQIDDEDDTYFTFVESTAESPEGFDYPSFLNSKSTFRRSGKRNPHRRWWNHVWTRTRHWEDELRKAFR